jgi:hypothetical protein
LISPSALRQPRFFQPAAHLVTAFSPYDESLRTCTVRSASTSSFASISACNSAFSSAVLLVPAGL